MDKIKQIPDNNDLLTKTFQPNPVDSVMSENSSTTSDSETDDSVYWIHQDNVKSGEQLHNVDLTAKQVIFLQSIMTCFELNKPIEAMEAFFNEGVIEHENLTNYFRDEVKCFWELLQIFRKFQ